jgi:hydrogenase-4 component B
MELIGTGVGLILSGGASGVFLGRWPRAAERSYRFLLVAGALSLSAASLRVLLGGGGTSVSLIPTLPGGRWVWGLDPLSAWFLLGLSLVAIPATIYGVPYLAAERGHRPVTAVQGMLALFLAALVGVFTAQAAVAFLLVWEVMALSAYFLIVFEQELDEVRRAGLRYFVLTHAGTAALLVMFLLWGRTGPDFTFASLAAVRPESARASAVILLLALFGFGVKAGMFPVHIWLPGAHAAAPSHVSALLSGVMIKSGIYGLLRVLALFGPPPPWWGWTVLLLGLASALLGVLWALAQHDLKRLLAYHSVENIGIILLGLGLGALGAAYQVPGLALLGVTGALVHTLNHALFKSLLFLGAGVVARATGTRDLARLGGLGRLMPRTAAAFLVGSLAIVGLPPLNGFVSEWLLLRGALTAGQAAGPVRFAGLAAAALGLVGALALACFARIGGAVFLGRSRSGDGAGATDPPPGMRFGLAMLAAACLLIGLAPGVAVTAAARVAATLPGLVSSGVGIAVLAGPSLTVLTGFSFAILALSAALWFLRARAQRGRPAWMPTWGCAFALPSARMQYTASSFSAPLLAAFPAVAAPEVVRQPGEFRTIPTDRVLRALAEPLWHRVRATALALRALQRGRVTTYLQYIVWVVLGLLGYLAFAGRGSP